MWNSKRHSLIAPLKDLARTLCVNSSLPPSRVASTSFSVLFSTALACAASLYSLSAGASVEVSPLSIDFVDLKLGEKRSFEVNIRSLSESSVTFSLAHVFQNEDGSVDFTPLVDQDSSRVTLEATAYTFKSAGESFNLRGSVFFTNKKSNTDKTGVTKKSGAIAILVEDESSTTQTTKGGMNTTIRVRYAVILHERSLRRGTPRGTLSGAFERSDEGGRFVGVIFSNDDQESATVEARAMIRTLKGRTLTEIPLLTKASERLDKKSRSSRVLALSKVRLEGLLPPGMPSGRHEIVVIAEVGGEKRLTLKESLIIPPGQNAGLGSDFTIPEKVELTFSSRQTDGFTTVALKNENMVETVQFEVLPPKASTTVGEKDSSKQVATIMVTPEKISVPPLQTRSFRVKARLNRRFENGATEVLTERILIRMRTGDGREQTREMTVILRPR